MRLSFLLKKTSLIVTLACLLSAAALGQDRSIHPSPEAVCLVQALEHLGDTDPTPGARVASWSDQRKLRYVQKVLDKRFNEKETVGVLKAMHSTNWEVGRDGKHTATFGNLTSQQAAKKERILIESGFDSSTANRIVRSGAVDTSEQLYDPFWREKRASFIRSRGLTESEAQVIESYSSDGYFQINQWLRGRQALSKTIEDQINLVEHALDKLPPYLGVSYRGQTLRPDFDVSQYPIGGTISLDSFWSSSLNRRLAEEWSGDTRHIVYEIVGSGQGKRIDDLSFFKSETEVLFRPGTRFKILDRRVDDQGNYFFRLLEEKPNSSRHE
jgi:hypothetical protein